jgi:hypothetical protein
VTCVAVRRVRRAASSSLVRGLVRIRRRPSPDDPRAPRPCTRR